MIIHRILLQDYSQEKKNIPNDNLFKTTFSFSRAHSLREKRMTCILKNRIVVENVMISVCSSSLSMIFAKNDVELNVNRI
jgi:hypothetical protein